MAKIRSAMTKKSAFLKVKKRTQNKALENRYSPDKRTRPSRTKLICRQCQAVYDGKSWMHFSKMNPAMVDELKISICPACHEKTSHLSDGILHISGSGVKPHWQDIKNLIMNMGKKAEAKNILDRVERIDENQNEMTVYTNKNQLAVIIGKHIASAYKGGKLEIKWSKGDKPVEVKWRYDKNL